MSTLRKYERAVVKAQNNQNFENAWEEYRNAKYVTKGDTGEILVDRTPKNTQKKKQNHYDDKQKYFNLFAWIANRKVETTEDED